jgi:threonine dehydrogenase-like Zn-dependent dehydrogenase
VIHAFDLVRPPAGIDVLIYGAGTIGLLAAYVASSLGAASVSLDDLDSQRAKKARTAGFAADAKADVFDQTDWELVVDATGAIPAITDGLTRLQRGGTFLQLGVAHPESTVAIQPYLVFQRELSVVGSMTTRNSFPRALSLLGKGSIETSLIVGEPFSLGDYAAAIDSAGRGQTLKVTVAPDSDSLAW